MIRSLAARLTLAAQLVALVVIIAFGFTSLWVTSRVLETERRTYVRESARRIAHDFDDELGETADTLAAARAVVEEGLEPGLQVEVRLHGRLLASTREILAGLRGGLRDTLPDGGDHPFVASAPGRSGAEIRVEASDAALRRSLSALERSLLVAALPILLLGLLLGYWIVRRALSPLPVMARRAAGLSLADNPRSLEVRSGLTELDQLAASFDRLLERLDDAMRAERRLTADASHELRTPLTVLSGELELLAGQVAPNSPAASGLARAAEQVAGMRELVEAILLLHRSRGVGAAGEQHFEILNLCDLARESVAEANARRPERAADLSLRAPDELLVDGEEALLASALRNLLDNALKFSESGRRVEVEVAGRDGHAVLRVDDQGPGVDEAERERIFDPFYRGAGARAGSSGFGLGLPIIRRVAEAHGGRVCVERSPGGGARFTLELPLHRAG